MSHAEPDGSRHPPGHSACVKPLHDAAYSLYACNARTAAARGTRHPPPAQEDALTENTATTEVTPADLTVVSRAAREHEVFERITDDSAWKVCQHGKRFVEVMAHWSDNAPFTVTTGRVNSTQRFARTVHADGTGEYSTGGCYNTVSRCPKCKSVGTLSTAQEAWCDVTTCSACDYRNVYMIGD